VSNLVLLFLCLVIGVVLRNSGRMPDNAHVTINAFIIHVSLPALTLLQIHNVILQPALMYSVAMPWLLFSGGAAFFWFLAKALRLSPATTGALMLSGGLANTSFVGLPMIETFYGREGMAIGILIDQFGTYSCPQHARNCCCLDLFHWRDIGSRDRQADRDVSALSGSAPGSGTDAARLPSMVQRRAAQTGRHTVAARARLGRSATPPWSVAG